MSISYSSDGRHVSRHKSRTLMSLIAINAAFAFVMLFAWKIASLFVIEPLTWATWMPVYRGSGLEDVVRYPFVLLWLWPIMGAAGAWFSANLGKQPVAFAFASLPIVILSLVFGWYYLTPPDWR